MGKINKTTAGAGPSSPLQTVPATTRSRVTTHEGAPAYLSDRKTEAFRLGVNLFGGAEKTFYDSGANRDKRFAALMEELAITDPTWTANFLVWLRGTANIRTAAITGAAHAIHSRLANSASVTEDELLSSVGMVGLNRYLANNVCQRADEPGELIAYWLKTFGQLPKAVKRGLGDAANRLYNEYSVQKYDTASHHIRFANVLNLTHAKPQASISDVDEEETGAVVVDRRLLFKHIIDRVYNNGSTTELPMVVANKKLRKDAEKEITVLLDGDRLKAAGMTWEDALSLAGSKLSKAQIWESIGPNMGYMAKLRNLRNFEEAGVSAAFKKDVVKHLTNRNAVLKSRQFPFRFLSAFSEVNSLQFQAALEQALEHSVENIPVFDGRTLVLIDTSASMSDKISNNSKMSRAGVAALFGAAVANKNAGNVDLVLFATNSEQIPVPVGGSVLNLVKTVEGRNGRVGHGTNTAYTVQRHFKPGIHKRVIVFTDCQSHYNSAYGIDSGIPADVFFYAFDLAGYRATDMETGRRRVMLAGLTDAAFKLIDMYERGENADWPWKNKQ
jgi:hypothetical protein